MNSYLTPLAAVSLAFPMTASPELNMGFSAEAAIAAPTQDYIDGFSPDGRAPLRVQINPNYPISAPAFDKIPEALAGGLEGADASLKAGSFVTLNCVVTRQDKRGAGNSSKETYTNPLIMGIKLAKKTLYVPYRLGSIAGSPPILKVTEKKIKENLAPC